MTEDNKHPLALGRSDRERRNGSGHAGQRGLARARPDSAKTVYRRRRESVVEGIRRTFGPAAAIQRCQIHKARNITERLPKEHHAATCRVLRQAWELDADKAEKLIRNLARRPDQQWPGVAASILEGADEVLTVVRLKLPKELRRSLATNIAENMMGAIRRVTRNVKRWRDAGVALRWAAAGMIEANKGFRRLNAHK
ncbi:transposase-like protein [Bradyrhizobium sp. GM6.1]